MLPPELLRDTAVLFVQQTDDMLAAAEQGLWELFLAHHERREQSMAVLMSEAGDSLLKRLPDMRDALQLALDKSLRIDDLARAQRDELGSNLASEQQSRRLRSTYRS
jgi:hypothetical protein